MSLKAWRTAIDAALTTHLGLTVYHWDAPSLDAPCVVISPAMQYLSPENEDESTFTMQTVRWDLLLFVRAAGEHDSYDQLDDLIDDLGDALATVDPPEPGSARPVLETVEAPVIATVGGSPYLSVACVCSTIRPNPNT